MTDGTIFLPGLRDKPTEQDLDYLRSVSITRTLVGEEFGWDTLADVKFDLVRHNLECAHNVFDNPQQFPKADRARLEVLIDGYEEFLLLHGHLELGARYETADHG